MKALRRRIEDEARFGIAGPTGWPAAVVAWHEYGVADIRPNTLTRYLVSLKQMRPFLDGLMVHQITADVLRDMTKARRKQGAGTATMRRDMTALSRVLDHAIAEGWIATNPTLAFRRTRLREKHTPIVLPRQEAIAAIIAAAPPRFADAMLFALETGMRQDEVFGLRHDQLATDAATVTIYGKGGKLRVIPYTAAARALVDRQPRYLRAAWVFWHGAGERWTSPSSRFGDVRRRVARKAAQSREAFDQFRFHDLRHLYAVDTLRAGGNIYALQGLLGHESIKTTERYLSFLTPEQALAAKHGVAHSGAREQRFGA